MCVRSGLKDVCLYADTEECSFNVMFGETEEGVCPPACRFSAAAHLCQATVLSPVPPPSSSFLDDAFILICQLGGLRLVVFLLPSLGKDHCQEKGGRGI